MPVFAEAHSFVPVNSGVPRLQAPLSGTLLASPTPVTWKQEW